jgi:hypothetical protein
MNFTRLQELICVHSSCQCKRKTTKEKWGTNTQEEGTIPDGVQSVADDNDYGDDDVRSKSQYPF